MNRFYLFRYIRNWLAYTPFFVCNAPFHRWSCYFVSCHRIASGFAWYEGEERAADTIRGLQELDEFVLRGLAEDYEKARMN